MIQGRESYHVATIDDLIAMKRHAGRPKDLIQIEILEQVAEALEERETGRPPSARRPGRT